MSLLISWAALSQKIKLELIKTNIQFIWIHSNTTQVVFTLYSLLALLHFSDKLTALPVSMIDTFQCIIICLAQPASFLHFELALAMLH